VCFVTLKNGIEATVELKEVIRAHVAKEIGSSAARRRAVRLRIAQDAQRQDHEADTQGNRGGGTVKGDTTTLEDFTVVARSRPRSDPAGGFPSFSPLAVTNKNCAVARNFE